jgi:Zn-dependent protease
LAEPFVAPRRCASCGTELSDALLACPACGRLVHAEELTRLAAEARQKEAADPAGALALWQRALALLPDGTRQRQAVAETVARLSAIAPAPPKAAPAPNWIRKLGPIGVVILGAWKLVGVAKLASFLSLLASFAVYWRTWGFLFGGGFIVSLYLHEMGHVIALRRAGIPASPPMFIPGFGAYVRMLSAPSDARTDARVGLAGPLAGAAVAVAFHVLWTATGMPLFRALAHTGAVLNLFNLIPIWSLDGSRGFRSQARGQRFLLVAIAAVAAALTHEAFLWVIAVVGALRALSREAPEKADHGGFALFAWLLAVLSLLAAQSAG